MICAVPASPVEWHRHLLKIALRATAHEHDGSPEDGHDDLHTQVPCLECIPGPSGRQHVPVHNVYIDDDEEEEEEEGEEEKEKEEEEEEKELVSPVHTLDTETEAHTHKRAEPTSAELAPDAESETPTVSDEGHILRALAPEEAEHRHDIETALVSRADDPAVAVTGAGVGGLSPESESRHSGVGEVGMPAPAAGTEDMAAGM